MEKTEEKKNTFKIKIIILFIFGATIINLFFTPKQQVMRYCDKQNENVSTSGRPWDVDFDKNNDGTYSISYHRDLLDKTYSHKNHYYSCSRVQVIPYLDYISWVLLLISGFLLSFDKKEKEDKKYD